MLKVRITAIRRSQYDDLMEKYENPLENACDTVIGTVYISENAERPEGLCNNAWRCMYSYVKTLAEGGGNFFDGWMKNERSAMISCDDGFRPVSFLLEAIEDKD